MGWGEVRWDLVGWLGTGWDEMGCRGMPGRSADLWVLGRLEGGGGGCRWCSAGGWAGGSADRHSVWRGVPGPGLWRRAEHLQPEGAARGEATGHLPRGRGPPLQVGVRSPRDPPCCGSPVPPVTRCCPSLCRYCQVNVPDELLRDLLPGPVTLVLKRSEELNKDLNPFTSVGLCHKPHLGGFGGCCAVSVLLLQ